jgi:hypothetical protein
MPIPLDINPVNSSFIMGVSMPTALIADVRGSRDLDNWPEVFAAITRTLTQANKRFKADLVVKFHPTVGDEFQGVLARPDIAFEAYTFLKASLPVRLYFGLGVGEVEKSGPGDTGLRGTAFYRARAALEACKDVNGHLRLDFSEKKTKKNQIVNTILNLIETIEDSWSLRQQEVINYYRINPEMTHEQIANHFALERSTVTHLFLDTRLKTVIEAEATLKNAFGAGW